MNCSTLTFSTSLSPFTSLSPKSFPKPLSPIRCGLRELKTRIESIKNTKKITEAMKLVAAAKVRRAQEAVINSRPFTQTLLEFLYYIIEQIRLDDVETPLTTIRLVKKVALVVVTGDRGLCGGFNASVLRKAEKRILELKKLDLGCVVISVGKKGNSYFRNRDYILVDRFIEGGGFPTVKEAQAIADDVFSLFISEEVDKVEILYTKFVSLVKSEPVIHTLLPLYGKSVDTCEDEVFRLTSKEGKLSVERDSMGVKREGFSVLPNLEFEQDPAQIVDAMMPLYLNSQILRALQESLASELASRMEAMSNATNNAADLGKSLNISYNRERQAKITGEILEIVAGAEALR